MEKETEIPAPHFDLATTLDSGQVFHWQRTGAGFCGMIADRAVYVEQHGDILCAKWASSSSGFSSAQAHKMISNYFALDHPLEEICASFPHDLAMDAACEFCHGLRILRQPKWECLATFICSSMKQVPHIRQISRSLRQRFGERTQICGQEIFSFPSPAQLARASELKLRQCALGYRAKNLLATAKHVHLGEADLNSWSRLSDDELRNRLCDLPGVGLKVANCVMLFAYERIAAFPIDVWIERVLRQVYLGRRRRVTGQIMAEFAAKHFGRYGGYAQQYLFHHARMTRRRKK